MGSHLLHLLSVIVFVLAARSGVRSQLQDQTHSTALTKAELLRSCYNKHYNGTASYFEDFLRGFNTSMYMYEVYASGKQTELALTIFVGATPERLAALEAQCRSYPGPLSAAIYVPLMQQQHGSQLTQQNLDVLKQAAVRVKEVFDRVEAAPSSPSPACALTALVLFEVVADAALAGLLPINSLRNAALLAASSPLVAMVDVDLAPSATLAGAALQPGASSLNELLESCERRSVWVLPAWETHKRLSMEEGTAVAVLAINGNKADLRRLDQEARIHYFAKLAYMRGHAATNFTRWFESDVPYAITYEINYEPWFIMSRRLMLPYDVRFRGYGWNKVQQVALVALSNFTFWVHPGAWLVHRPHEKSRGQELYGGRGGRREEEEETRSWQGTQASLSRLFHRRVSALRHVAIRDMRRGTYAAAVDPQTRHCREVLPWWAEAGRAG